MTTRFLAPALAALAVLLVLGVTVWRAQTSLQPQSAETAIRQALETAIFDDTPLSPAMEQLLRSAIESGQNAHTVRADALLYALGRHESLLSKKPSPAGSPRIPGDIAAVSSRLAQKLLETNLGDDSDSALDAERLGIDAGLLGEPALLPMSAARQMRYEGAPPLPDRDAVFVQALTSSLVVEDQKAKASVPEAMAARLFAFQSDRPEEAHLYPTEPYPVQGQVAQLLRHILDIQPRILDTRASKGQYAQVIGVAAHPDSSTLVRKYCSSRTAGGHIALERNEERLIGALLVRSGVNHASLRGGSCVGTSLLVSGTGRPAEEARWTMVMTPKRDAPVSAVLFLGFAPTLHIEAVGNEANPSIYVARQVDGAGGFLTSFVVDAARRRVIASTHQLPDGELHFLLKSGTGPVYLFIRQSVITSARGIRAAAPKRTLTAILRWNHDSGRYGIINVRLSRHSRTFPRSGPLHPSQLPGTVTKVTCEQSRHAIGECETGAEALLAEAQAHEDALDPHGASQYYAEFTQRHAGRLLAGRQDQHLKLLEIQQKHAFTLLASEQYNRLSVLCEEQKRATWVGALDMGSTGFARSGCENLLGLAARISGDYAAAKAHFETAYLLNPRDAAPFGNLIRHRIDVNQPRQALGLLTSRIFDPAFDSFYTRYQRLQFSKALSDFNGSPSALLFLLPDDETTRHFFGLTLATAGGIMQRAENKDLSLSLLDEGFHYFDTFGLRELGPELLLDYAKTLVRARQHDAAAFILKPLLDPDVSASGPIRARAWDLMAGMAHADGEPAAALRWSTRALDALRASLPEASDRARYMGSLLGANRTIIERWFALAQTQGVSAQVLYKSALFWKSSPAFASLEDTPSPTTKSGECMVHFMKVEQRLWRFDNCDGNRPSLKVLKKPYTEYERSIAQSGLERTSSSGGFPLLSSVKYPESSLDRSLAVELLGDLPLSSLLRLAITPDLALGDIAWTALPAPHSVGYLIDTIRVFQYHPGLNLAVAGDKGRAAGVGAIVSAGPATAANGRLPPLRQVALEMQALEAAWPEIPLLKLTDVSGALSQPRWQDIFERSALVHIAAHGVRNVLQPDLSAIVLSDRLNGIKITPREVAELEMGHVQLAIVNVCSSGFVRRGDSLVDVGFRTALLGRGTGAVVDTGWEISDERGAEFARALYQSLRAGAAIEIAFFHAVRAVRASNPDPYSWGAYSLSVRNLQGVARPFTLHRQPRQ